MHQFVISVHHNFFEVFHVNDHKKDKFRLHVQADGGEGVWSVDTIVVDFPAFKGVSHMDSSGTTLSGLTGNLLVVFAVGKGGCEEVVTSHVIVPAIIVVAVLGIFGKVAGVGSGGGSAQQDGLVDECYHGGSLDSDGIMVVGRLAPM